MLKYHRGDERPAWRPTVTLNGAADDLSTGFTFVVKIIDGSGTAVLTKTTNITGAADGEVTVAWAEDELDITPDAYRLLLIATRTADSLEWTIEDRLTIEAS